jgi:ferredoxin-nitrite reductase
VGLSSLQNGMDSIRNVVTSSVAGLCDLEILDARPIVAAVSDWITNNHEGNFAVANLPRKVNVHITGHPHDMGACSNDIGLYPARNGEDLGFNVMVGGAVGGKHPRLADDLDVFVLPKDVLGVVRGIIEVFHEHGPREERHKSRLKWLLAEWGDQKFRAELERHLGHTLLRGGQDLRVHGTPRLPLGVNAQKQTGLVYIGAHVPVGRSNAQALYDLADLVDKYGNGEARFTIEQNILVPNIPEASLEAALAHPFFVAHTPFPHATEEGVVSCTGIEFCPFALIETKSRALEVAQLLKQEFMQQALPLAEAPRMHWSGCQHACASHHIGDFGFQGTKARVDGQMVDAVDVYIGGRIGRCAQLGEKILDRVPIAALPQKIVELTRTHLPHLLQTPVLAASSDD